MRGGRGRDEVFMGGLVISWEAEANKTPTIHMRAARMRKGRACMNKTRMGALCAIWRRSGVWCYFFGRGRNELVSHHALFRFGTGARAMCLSTSGIALGSGALRRESASARSFVIPGIC